ncbi:MAG: hypothetical protein ABJ215_09605 [Alphaproteobacteria bacterium]
MMTNQMKQSPKARPSRLIGVGLLSLLALSACTAGSSNDGAETDLELPRFDRTMQDTIGGA